MPKVSAVSLFSGGLDSILASRLIMDQGIYVKCLHFVSPFFGKPKNVDFWHDEYGLDVECIDVSDLYVELLKAYPRFGFGKVMNPCIDCKIMMLNVAKKVMKECGASFIISGGVIGQRPMSQRKDAMNIISRESDVRECLIRPLCAKLMNPSKMELEGIVDRGRLCGISGRGRDAQFRLANEMGIVTIPAPAGGCKLCEKENAPRYWQVLRRISNPTANDFYLANYGRQMWSDAYWLAIGRHSDDNEALSQLARDEDFMIKLCDYPGPLGILRPIGNNCNDVDQIYDAAQCVAIHTPKAVRAGEFADIRISRQSASYVIKVEIKKNSRFSLPTFDAVRDEIHKHGISSNDA